jgi:hypothetical protein
MTAPERVTEKPALEKQPAELNDEPRKIAEEIKENADKLLEAGMYCIFDWEDLRGLINNSDYSSEIPPENNGKKFAQEELGLRENSIAQIENDSLVPIIFVRINQKDKVLNEITLSFVVNDSRDVHLPNHEAFPEDPDVRRKLNISFGELSGWLS